MRTLILTASAIALAASTAAAAPMTDNWRAVANNKEANKIAALQRSWDAGLREARQADPALLRRLGKVVSPTAALTRPHPTDGMYQCRTIKLGQKGPGGNRLIAYGWFRCHVELTQGGDLNVRKTTGSQRPAGKLYPYTSRRLAFVGTIALSSSESSWPDYGTQPDRDVGGVFERIGRNHYRLLMPQPEWESELDILEIKR